MSWSERQQHIERLRDRISKGDMTIGDLLVDPFLFTAIGMRDITLKRFILSHLIELVDICLGKSESPPGLTRKQCIDLLTMPNSFIIEDLTTNSSVLDHIIHSCDNDESLNNAFLIFQRILNFRPSLFISNVADDEGLMNLYFQNFSNSNSYQTLVTLCNTMTKEVTSWFSKFELHKKLFSKLEEGEDIAKQSLYLLSLLVMCGRRTPKVLQFLAERENLKYLLDFGINAATVPVSALSLQVAFKTWMLTDDLSGNNYFDDGLKLITEYCPKLCQFIMSSTEFTSDKQYAMEMVTSVVLTKNTVDEQTFDFIGEMWTRLLQLPTNSFFHRSFIELFKAFMELDEQWKELLSKYRVRETIIEQTQTKNFESPSFRACIYSAVKAIIDATKKSEYTQLESWSLFIENEYNSYVDRCEASYGGDHQPYTQPGESSSTDSSSSDWEEL